MIRSVVLSMLFLPLCPLKDTLSTAVCQLTRPNFPQTPAEGLGMTQPEQKALLGSSRDLTNPR
jgi:hypothetical protein